jgi:hypothetical protein
MTRVKIRAGKNAARVMSRIAHSDEVAGFLRPTAEQILAAARNDPNPRYVAELIIREHHSRGRFGRVSWRVGCSIPELGAAVEAKRGTLARAMGVAGV